MTGIVLAVAAGCFWGTMAVSGQYMITACGFNAEELTTVRIAGAGILMLVFGMPVSYTHLTLPTNREV